MHPTSLPDPAFHSEFYEDVPVKRALAWAVDAVVVTVLSLLLMPLTFFTAILYFPAFFVCVGFAYRVITIARGSATWGMRLMSIELRSREGAQLDLGTAFLHTLGYSLSLAIFPLQLISVVLMLTTERRQGLSDLALGTAMINRAALR